MPVRRKQKCPRCRKNPKTDHQGRYCLPCRRAYRRMSYRSTGGYGGLSKTAKLKARCRAYTRTLLARGQLQKAPCSDCGWDQLTDIRAHHPEYTNPKLVEWLCIDCHAAAHL